MVVQVDGLTKKFPIKKGEPFTAVDNIKFSIKAGERVAFIGPNGAGKSTTLKMLTGILYPSAGSATVAGLTPWQQRQELAYKIGVVFGQRSQLWYHLPVQDSFDLLGKIYDVSPQNYVKRLARVAEVLQIEDLVHKPVKSLSLGQRMRCEIAASLLHKPKLLFLDEPTIGLDVTAKALLREHLKGLAETEETTIMLTSHDTGDIEEICDRVILINHGQILLDKPLKKLRSEFMANKQITLVTDEENPELDLEGAEIIAREPHQMILSVAQSKQSKLIGHALKTLAIRDISIENAPLERIIRGLYESNKHG